MTLLPTIMRVDDVAYLRGLLHHAFNYYAYAWHEVDTHHKLKVVTSQMLMVGIREVVANLSSLPSNTHRGRLLELNGSLGEVRSCHLRATSHDPAASTLPFA